MQDPECINLAKKNQLNMVELLKAYESGETVEDCVGNMVKYINKYVGKILYTSKNLFVVKNIDKYGYVSVICKSKQDFIEMLDHRSVLIPGDGDKLREMSIGKIFMFHPLAKTYNNHIAVAQSFVPLVDG